MPHNQRFSEFNPELDRLSRTRWREWGPYLAEREWGTVREDYSANGNFWHYFRHDHSRSRAYRWCEDGIAGISDSEQHLCIGLAMWNENDAILKERLYGLTPIDANHGEDVKECYFYLDAVPSHAYLKMLYKYPQSAFPYDILRTRNAKFSRRDPEFELLDTGIFRENRYFDVFVEYAKVTPDDIFMRVTAHNRGPEAAPLHLLPHVWFRNTWSWSPGAEKPELRMSNGTLEVEHPDLKGYQVYAEGDPTWLFTDNETHMNRVFGYEVPAGHFKDAFHDYVIHGDRTAIRQEGYGTKAAAHYVFDVAPGDACELRLRIANGDRDHPFEHFDACFAQRIEESDAYYGALQAGIEDDDLRRIQRQAFAGMIWNKQYYHYVVWEWMKGDPKQPEPPDGKRAQRNEDWEHLNTADILSMPDTWEFPWFAAWDTAFHAVTFALIDPDFAKDQLQRLTEEWFMHPNGQLPAYEAGFSDVNPPVHAWATWRVFCLERDLRGGPGDVAFLERIFHKLLLNFGWWVNRKDKHGHNIFQGGFLGLDNIGVFDRGAPPPEGGRLDQADATSWMAMFCLDMMRIALELASHNPIYESVASKFFQHFLHIAKAINGFGPEKTGLWDPEDAFYYDVLNEHDGDAVPLKIRSIVGLIPLLAVEVLEPELLERVPHFTERMDWVLENRPDLAESVPRWQVPGVGKIHMLSLLSEDRIRGILQRLLHEDEFLSEYGVRALSRYHRDHPYRFEFGGNELTVSYEPGESNVYMFGGNSNWRGPIWFPVNYLIVRALREYQRYFRDDLRVPCPSVSGEPKNLGEVADDISRRLIRIFERGEDGRRPLFGESPIDPQDPHWKDYLLFYEYFHGDNGRGCGASHQTGWTGLVANLIRELSQGD